MKIKPIHGVMFINAVYQAPVLMLVGKELGLTWEFVTAAFFITASGVLGWALAELENR